MFRPISRLTRRLYHPNTLEHALPKELYPLTYSRDSIQYRVLEHALKVNVPLHGFNERAIVASLAALGCNSSMLSVLGAPNSPSFFNASPAVLELVKFHLVTKRLDLTKGLEESNEEPTLEQLFLKRLQMNEPISSHLSQMLSYLSIPGEFLVQTALPELHRLSDDMVYFSREPDSHDFAWYSKRMAISCAYISSELFMAQDKSDSFRETIEFAQEKLHKVTKLGEYYNNTEEYLWYTLLMSVNLAKSQMTRG
ncbi:LAFE_0B02454g1_1 [Lachancea fermentati]|uniref:Ubiquinone biosynthesis protein n=1 Tax=Lachancea fermentati TaxID=4955 RepID=A0A1G4M7K3_LACFM|nr:LAFE_0B02454g1_1 [Lachancea fermentati]